MGDVLTYDVYIERAEDDTEGGRQRLAVAMTRRYGIPTPDVIARLGSGTLRVKRGVPPDTAKQLGEELQVLGARVRIVESNPASRGDTAPYMALGGPPGQTLLPGQGIPGMAQMPTGAAPAMTPQGGLPRPQAVPPPRPNLPAPAPAPTPPPAAPGEFSLGALAQFGDGDGNFALETLDGNADNSGKPAGLEKAGASGVNASAFAPPEDDAPPDLGVLDTAPPPPATKKQQTFAPPGSGHGEEDAPLALDEPRTSKRSQSQLIPLSQDHGTASATLTMTGERTKRTAIPVEGGPLAKHFVGQSVLRAAAGVGLALALGYIPAHIVSSGDGAKVERVAEGVRADIERLQTPTGFAKLEEVYTESRREITQIRAQSRNVSMAAWMVAFGVLTFVWFRLLA